MERKDYHHEVIRKASASYLPDEVAQNIIVKRESLLEERGKNENPKWTEVQSQGLGSRAKEILRGDFGKIYFERLQDLWVVDKKFY